MHDVTKFPERSKKQLDASLLPQSGSERCVRSSPTMAAARGVPPERRRWFIEIPIGHFDLTATEEVSLVVLLDQM